MYTITKKLRKIQFTYTVGQKLFNVWNVVVVLVLPQPGVRNWTDVVVQ